MFFNAASPISFALFEDTSAASEASKEKFTAISAILMSRSVCSALAKS